MRKIVLTALAATALACPAPGAHATSDSRHKGGCGFHAVSHDTTGEFVGEMDVQAVVYSPTPGSNPVWATVTCYITVNDVPQPGTFVTASGAVVVAGGGAITYTGGVGDVVSLCERIDFTGPGDTTPTIEGCPLWDHEEIPPYAVWAAVDTVLCGALAPNRGTYGPVLVTEQGDVYLAGEPLWDCPPYDIEWD